MPQSNIILVDNHKRPRALGGPSIESTSLRKASWKWLSANDQEKLEDLHKIPSQVAALEEGHNAEAYFEARVADVETSYDATRAEVQTFKAALKDGKIDQGTYSKAVQGLNKAIESSETELRFIKRHKRHLLQDVEEMAPSKTLVQASWLDLLVDKIRLAGTMLKKKKKFNQGLFRDNCLQFYGAEKIVGEGEDQAKYQYCVISGEWFPELHLGSGKSKTQIIAAHIVPKVLDGSELNQLFQVGETLLAEPRNSLPLLKVIEQALDNGDIAIVPDKMDGPRVEVYKVMLVNDQLRNKPYHGEGAQTRKWGSLDGKTLRFLTAGEVQEVQASLPPQRAKDRTSTPDAVAANRPAQRYLYFRCVATYLLAKRKAAETPSLALWIKRYEAARGTMWLTPGKYAKQTMMTELAMAAGDMFLPEAREMFKSEPSAEVDSESTNPQDWDDDKIQAIGLKQKMLEYEKDKETEDDSEEEGEGSENEEE